jgi:hypothetical protein
MGSNRSNGGYIGYSQSDTSATASGVWGIQEVSNRRSNDNWPELVVIAYDTLTLDTVDVRDPAAYELTATNNTTADYGIHHVQFTADSTSHTLYIGFEVRGTSSAFYKDYTVAGVRIKFGTTTLSFSNGSWTGWAYTTAGVTAATNPSSQTFYTFGISQSTIAERFNIDSAGTASASTGCLDGIGNTPNFDSNAISQVSGSSYLYAETSSPTANGDTIWIRYPFSPAVNDLVKIDIADYLNTDTTGTYASVVQNSVRLLVT